MMSRLGQKASFTALIKYDPESKMFVGSVIGLSGAHTQASSLDELRANLKEVIELCLEDSEAEVEEAIQFVGLMQVKLD